MHIVKLNMNMYVKIFTEFIYGTSRQRNFNSNSKKKKKKQKTFHLECKIICQRQQASAAKSTFFLPSYFIFFLFVSIPFLSFFFISKCFCHFTLQVFLVLPLSPSLSLSFLPKIWQIQIIREKGSEKYFFTKRWKTLAKGEYGMEYGNFSK